MAFIVSLPALFLPPNWVKNFNKNLLRITRLENNIVWKLGKILLKKIIINYCINSFMACLEPKLISVCKLYFTWQEATWWLGWLVALTNSLWRVLFILKSEPPTSPFSQFIIHLVCSSWNCFISFCCLKSKIKCIVAK